MTCTLRTSRLNVYHTTCDSTCISLSSTYVRTRISSDSPFPFWWLRPFPCSGKIIFLMQKSRLLLDHTMTAGAVDLWRQSQLRFFRGFFFRILFFILFSLIFPFLFSISCFCYTKQRLIHQTSQQGRVALLVCLPFCLYVRCLAPPILAYIKLLSSGGRFL